MSGVPPRDLVQAELGKRGLTRTNSPSKVTRAATSKIWTGISTAVLTHWRQTSPQAAAIVQSDELDVRCGDGRDAEWGDGSDAGRDKAST